MCILELKNMGFKVPGIIVDKYGIKVHIGNENKDDWAIEIPNKYLMKKVENCSQMAKEMYESLNGRDFGYLGINEKQCLRIVSEWRCFIEKECVI